MNRTNVIKGIKIVMIIRPLFAHLIPLVLLPIFACLPAAGSPLAYVYSATGQFGVFDLGSGTYLPGGDIGDVLLADITTAPGQRIYALDADQNAGLRAINAATAQTSLIGPTGVALTGIETTRLGALYAQSATSLYSVNTVTGTASFIGDFNIANAFEFLEGAFDDSDHLFATGFQPGDMETSLYSVNVATGEATRIGPNSAFVQSIVYAGGVFYGFTSNLGTLTPGPIVTLDPLTGIATPFIFQDERLAPVVGAGILNVNSVPEAGTLLLFTGGLAVVIVWKRVATVISGL